jgi:hypothetical protein
MSGQKYTRNLYTPFDYIRTSVMSAQNRQERYVDFDQMEFDPFLASALDLYADSITTHTEVSPVLHIECTNDEIKNILQTLFYDVLAMESNAFYWARNVCKYGDFFFILKWMTQLEFNQLLLYLQLKLKDLKEKMRQIQIISNSDGIMVA